VRSLFGGRKNDGIPVTAETTPHFISLDESAIGEYDTMAKVSMPLRTAADCEALLTALEEGVIDCIASDHAPHEMDSKLVEFDHASFGLIGFQTTLALTLARVRDGSLSLNRAIGALSSDAARCLNMTPTTISKGAAADITILDLERRQTYSADVNRSKSANTPFMGWELQGIATNTIVGGREIYCIDEHQSEE